MSFDIARYDKRSFFFFIENTEEQSMNELELDVAVEEMQCNEEHNNQISFLRCMICNKRNYQNWEEY